MVTSMPTALPLARAIRSAAPKLVPGQAARHAEIDSRHDGVVEAIGVEMDEEAVQFRPRQVVDRLAGGGLDAHRAHGGEIIGA